MPIPENARRIMEALLEQSKKEERNEEKLRARVRDMVVALGIRPTPCGMITVGRLINGMAEHCAEHVDGIPPIDSVLKVLDEFLAMWVIQRLEEEPGYLDRIKAGIHPVVRDMFQADVPEVKVV